MRFFGIEIERKTDILAFTAFLLSLGGISYQIVTFIRGPDVTLAKPQQVVVYMYPMRDSKTEYLTLISPVAYVNRGHSQNNALVMKESVSFVLKGEQKNYVWHQFVSVSTSSESGVEGMKTNSKIEIRETQLAAPFVVPGSGAVSHYTWFAARYDGEYLKKKDFLQTFEKVRQGTDINWTIEFHSETLNDGNKMSICEVTLTPRLMENIQRFNWVAINCN